MNDLLNLVGLMKKAGKLELGEAPVGVAARAKKARAILLASDAAENTIRRAEHFAQCGGAVLLTLPHTKAELGYQLGRSSCAMLAVTDAGLAASAARKLAALDPVQYADPAAALDSKAARVLARQKEKARHEKRLARQTAKPWVKRDPK